MQTCSIKKNRRVYYVLYADFCVYKFIKLNNINTKLKTYVKINIKLQAYNFLVVACIRAIVAVAPESHVM